MKSAQWDELSRLLLTHPLPEGRGWDEATPRFSCNLKVARAKGCLTYLFGPLSSDFRYATKASMSAALS
jgi:hypothetical protein